MAPTDSDFVEYSLKLLTLSLFLRCVSSQFCTDPYPPTCTCSPELFECISANLTQFPATLPNAQTLQIIILSDNMITSIPSDVLTSYPLLQMIDLSLNPVTCDSNIAGLTGIKTVNGTCSTGGDISAFLESLQGMTTSAVDDLTMPNPSTGTQKEPVTATQPQPMTDAAPQPKSTGTLASTTQQPGPTRLYVLAIIIPVLLIVVLCIVIVLFIIKRNRKQQEVCNSAIRYSVVRKQAGAENRVYSNVTTEL